MNRTFIVACLAGASIVASPVIAEEKTATLSMSDYDMSTTAGVDAAHRALLSLATSVCSDSMRTWTWGKASSVLAKCVKKSTDRAVEAADVTALTTYHAALPASARYDVARAAEAVERKFAAAE
ncbi:MAG: UrcA family protein [Pseudomonadota bacterium]